MKNTPAAEKAPDVPLKKGQTAMVAPDAWNTVRFEDGTSAIFDVMHNKSSVTTPGRVDPYAKQYYTTDDEPLYKNGLRNNV